jgi:hypothetical protein
MMLTRFLIVTFQHRLPGKHVVTETDRHRNLQMGKSGHDGIGLVISDLDQGRL